MTVEQRADDPAVEDVFEGRVMGERRPGRDQLAIPAVDRFVTADVEALRVGRPAPEAASRWRKVVLEAGPGDGCGEGHVPRVNVACSPGCRARARAIGRAPRWRSVRSSS